MTTSETCNLYGIDNLCLRIADGLSMRQLATEIGVSKGSVLNWIASDTDRSARVSEARRLAADVFADMAQEVLEDAKMTKPGIAQAKELSHHFRWRASMADSRRFGTKVELNATVGLHTLQDEELDAREAELERQIDVANAALVKAGLLPTDGEQP